MRLDTALSAAGVRIVHLKLLDQSVAGYIKAAICCEWAGTGCGRHAGCFAGARHDMLLNIRAAGDPQVLREIVEREFAALPARLEWRAMQSFRPSPPRPQNPTGAELLRRAESLPPRQSR